MNSNGTRPSSLTPVSTFPHGNSHAHQVANSLKWLADCVHLQVLDKVQLDNLHALAPAGTPAALALCRELAGPSSRAPSVGTTASGTAAVSTLPTQRRQVTTLPRHAMRPVSRYCISHSCSVLLFKDLIRSPNGFWWQAL